MSEKLQIELIKTALELSDKTIDSFKENYVALQDFFN